MGGGQITLEEAKQVKLSHAVRMAIQQHLGDEVNLTEASSAQDIMTELNNYAARVAEVKKQQKDLKQANQRVATAFRRSTAERKQLASTPRVQAAQGSTGAATLKAGRYFLKNEAATQTNGGTTNEGTAEGQPSGVGKTDVPKSSGRGSKTDTRGTGSSEQKVQNNGVEDNGHGRRGGVKEKQLQKPPKKQSKKRRAELREESGFDILRHRLIFEGICPECRLDA